MREVTLLTPKARSIRVIWLDELQKTQKIPQFKYFLEIHYCFKKQHLIFFPLFVALLGKSSCRHPEICENW